jgi:hypothetical protein
MYLRTESIIHDMSMSHVFTIFVVAFAKALWAVYYYSAWHSGLGFHISVSRRDEFARLHC